MAYQPANIDKLLCTPDFGSYDNVLATHLTNKATGQGFDMDNLGMIDFKTLNYVFSEYNKKTRANAPMFLAIKIQKYLALNIHLRGKFLLGQSVTSDSILHILSKIDQEYMAASSGIGAEDKDAKYAVAPVVFKSR